jgi:lipopolysaccharide transport system permease protein
MAGRGSKALRKRQGSADARSDQDQRVSLAGSRLVQVFLTKLKFNLKSEASKTYLGYVWWVLEPALYVGVLYLVFGTFRAKGGMEFVIFLIVGKIPYLWFQKSVVNASRSVLTGRGLINQVAIHKAFFPLISIGQDLVKQIFVFVLMFVVLLSIGLSFDWAWVYFSFIVIAQMLLIIACALIAAAIIPFVPDFRYIITTGMTLLMLMSGIFFDYKTVVLEKHQALFLLNPMARLLKNYRQVLIDNTQPDWAALALLSAVSVIVILLMLHLYRRLDTAFARMVS